MTLASSIIAKAYRENNLIPLGATPNSNQITEALSRLNDILSSSVGNEIGGELRSLNIGGPYDESELFDFWVASDVRLMLNMSATKTLYLDPDPYDGQRLAVVDVLGTLPTYPLILNGNGRQIEAASSITLNDDYLVKEWLYRADTGNWTVITPIVSGDQLPFPSDFDDYFTLMLALRLDPMHGQNFAPEQIKTLERGRRNIRSRYRNKKSVFPDYVGKLSGTFRYLRNSFDVARWM